MKGAQDFLALLKKNNEKNKYEKIFQLKVRRSIKIKTNRNLLCALVYEISV